MIIPHHQLSAEALQGLIEEFVTRDGTDYGVSETPTQIKVEQVKQHLNQGTAVILYDTNDSSYTLIFKDQIPATDRI